MKKNLLSLKRGFDRFLRDHGAYQAWYERYRLDNLVYSDEVPMKDFLQSIIESGDPGRIAGMFYSGIQGTCMNTAEGDKFIETHKKVDILGNGVMADLDLKWIDTWKTYVDISRAGSED